MRLAVCALLLGLAACNQPQSPPEAKPTASDAPELPGRILGLRSASESSFTMADDGEILAILTKGDTQFTPTSPASAKFEDTDTYVLSTDRAGVRVRAFVVGFRDGAADAQPKVSIGPRGGPVDLSSFLPAEGNFQACHDFDLAQTATIFDVKRSLQRVAGQSGSLKLTTVEFMVIAPDAPPASRDDCDPPPIVHDADVPH